MRRILPHAACAAAAAAILQGCADIESPAVTEPRALASAVQQNDEHFEVWLVDQSNSPGKTYGGTIAIYRGPDLMGESASSAEPSDVIDLSGATASLCMASTGANPVRPHMLVFNADHRRAVLAFVASGHVVVFDAAGRAPVACLRTSVGSGGARQAHAAFVAPNDSYILVANQNGKRLERFSANFGTDVYAPDPAATLDLATCTTPSGAPCESPLTRPDNAPICPVLEGSGGVAFVTLRGGGMFVVNPSVTPMAIVGEYDRATVHPNGCGGVQAGGGMFINSGGGTAGNLHEFDIYRFPISGYSATNPPNVPAPTVIFSDDVPERDSHGMVLAKHGRYLWAADRGENVAEIFAVTSGAHVGTVDMSGPESSDPTPDLGDIAPSGNRIFFALRGPNPLTADPHVSTGSTPGLGVYQVTEGGRNGFLKAVVRVSNVDGAGVERADPHAARVRRL
jgi:hypothetical protein